MMWQLGFKPRRNKVVRMCYWTQKCNLQHQGSISPTFYKELLHPQIPKHQKDTQVKQLFALLGSVRVKAAHKHVETPVYFFKRHLSVLQPNDDFNEHRFELMESLKIEWPVQRSFNRKSIKTNGTSFLKWSHREKRRLQQNYLTCSQFHQHFTSYFLPNLNFCNNSPLTESRLL